MRILLTGGCGFIGSAVVRHLIRATDHQVVNVDKMTYAASEDALEEARRSERHLLVRADIAEPAAMRLASGEAMTVLTKGFEQVAGSVWVGRATGPYE